MFGLSTELGIAGGITVVWWGQTLRSLLEQDPAQGKDLTTSQSLCLPDWPLLQIFQGRDYLGEGSEEVKGRYCNTPDTSRA